MTLLILLTLIAADLSGPVVGVTDGDTVTVLVGENTSALTEVKIRLSEIDSPEKNQPFGMRSKQALSSEVFNQTVRVESTGKDRYGRTLGTLYLGSENINHWLVREGWAWRYDRYSKSEELLRLQDEARAAKRGLWADKEPVRPWEWRKR